MILRSLRSAIRALLPVVLAFLVWAFSPATFVLAQRPGNVLERDSARTDTGKQLDLIDIGKRLLHIKPSKPRATSKNGIYFAALPFSTQVPGGGTAIITSATAGFYLGNRADTYMSKLSFTPYTNFKKRFGLPIRSYLWLNENS
ncbi:hypothetical protein SAMN05216327_12328 [Dyadobacter sp. SG02]|uniref:hypothetical protein n=1 Tax=Dyadobacter sp. SG02 TaxID=1855291 RepID=UPI0008C1E186|nr:hypothetical protein [Dyadobacter sp. SG02]SEJ83755.1 hypothetical protein SAMN05216327_12328 [Dyadobacter sp. SG02]